MASGPNIHHSMEALWKNTLGRLTIVERRLAVQGGGGSGGTTVLAGLLSPFGGVSIPSGWLLCDGSAVLRVAYPQLFDVIGTTWGAGDGSSTFNLPDLRGRAVVGRDAAQTEFDTIGETGGSKTHDHPLNGTGAAQMSWEAGGRIRMNRNGGSMPTWNADVQTSGTPAPLIADTTASNGGIELVGGTGDGSSLPPYGVTNWLISTGSGVGGGGTPVPALPDPWTYALNGTVNADGAAATWTDIAVDASKTYALTDPMWVLVTGSAYITGAASTYGMIGVQATGALALEPEQGIDGTAGKFGYTAYGETSANGGKTLTFTKPLLLPAGSTTLKLRKRRNVATGVPTLGYPTITVMPMHWTGAPGTTVADDTGWVDLTSSLLAGFTGSIQGRRIGNSVEIRAQLTTSAGWSAGTSVVEFASGVPAIFLPITRNAWGPCYISGYPLVTLIRPAGTMAISNRTAIGASTSIQFTITYFAG